MTELFVIEDHSQLLDLWLERDERNLSICHIDFHCDMRGLLINKKRGSANFINKNITYIHQLDLGSFLSHAIMQGIVTSLRWIHDDYGGRNYDLYCVKYETDLSALPHRLVNHMQKGKTVPLKFEEMTFEQWDYPSPNEYLDIDWDAIAFKKYDDTKIQKLTNAVLEREYPTPPACVYLCLSPGYSNPNKSLFQNFLSGLEEKFNTKAIHLPLNQKRSGDSPPENLWHRGRKRVILKLRKYGIY